MIHRRDVVGSKRGIATAGLITVEASRAASDTMPAHTLHEVERVMDAFQPRHKRWTSKPKPELLREVVVRV
jgi:hypothetical protein